MPETSVAAGYDNLELVAEGRPIDEVNAAFYGRFQYPWPPQVVRRRLDESLEPTLLSQSVGEWTGDVLPERPRIWVAGCGTNQAVLTAVRFPRAQVVGSDVSTESLAASRQLADRLGVPNLDLRAESINDATYDGEFDYVISTGVIHHNGDPEQTLKRITAALTADGLLELMVYNRYHCVEAIAVQKAVRLFNSTARDGGFDADMAVARAILAARPELVLRIKPGFSGLDHFEAAAADALIQPVMHTFTVAELAALAGACGLDLGLPCVNQFDIARDCVEWNLRFADADLAARYESMSDVDRWQLTNLVELERSPMLWFYLRRSGRSPRPGERDVLERFHQQVFEVADTSSQVLIRQPDGTYRAGGRPKPYPARPPGGTARAVLDAVAVRGRARLADVLAELGVPADPPTLRGLRTRLSTAAFPHLRRVPDAEGS